MTRITTRTGGAVDFVYTENYKGSCGKKGCLTKGKFKCGYCNLLFCKEHRAPLPLRYRSSFRGKGHYCLDLPKSESINNIIRKHPYLEESIVVNTTKPIEIKKPEETKFEDIPFGQDFITEKPIRPEIPEKPTKPTKPTKSIKPVDKEPVIRFNYKRAIYIILFLVVISLIIWKWDYLNQEVFGFDGNNANISNYAFQKINTYRLTNKLSEINFDRDASKMASYLSTEKQKGIDHIQDINQVSSRFNLNSGTVAFFGSLEQNDEIDAKYMSDRWTGMSAITDKILNSNYNVGAVSCNNKICFLVLSEKAINTGQTILDVSNLGVYVFYLLIVILFIFGTFSKAGTGVKVFCWVILILIYVISSNSIDLTGIFSSGTNALFGNDNLLQNSTWITNGGTFMSSAYDPHWSSMPISYQIASNCGSYEGGRIREAFEIIQNSTKRVKFVEDTSGADIDITCERDFPTSTSWGVVESGLAGPSMIGENIQSATIVFYNVKPDTGYYPGGCTVYPDTEMHEILHTMGFGHTSRYGSLMNAYSNGCNSRLDKEIIDALNEIYS